MSILKKMLHVIEVPFLPTINLKMDDIPRYRSIDYFYTDNYKYGDPLCYDEEDIEEDEKIDEEKKKNRENKTVDEKIDDLSHEQFYVSIRTRTGGGNREGYEDENNKMIENEFYVEDYDCIGDTTYACFVFKVDKKWNKDIFNFMLKKYDKLTEEYKNKIQEFYPETEFNNPGSTKNN